jgi:hypothetical protein
MKCPKCEFVSFEGTEICKKCGYNFTTRKGGKSFLSRMKEKMFEEELEEITPKEASEKGAVKKKAEKAVKEKPVTEVKKEAEKVVKEKPVAEVKKKAIKEAAAPPEAAAPVEEEPQAESTFDAQFDDLFGDDKEAVKGGDSDRIKITATDANMEEGGVKEEVPDYGFSEDSLYNELVIDVGDTDQLFEESNNNVKDYIVPPQEVTYDRTEKKEEPAKLKVREEAVSEAEPEEEPVKADLSAYEEVDLSATPEAMPKPASEEDEEAPPELGNAAKEFMDELLKKPDDDQE